MPFRSPMPDVAIPAQPFSDFIFDGVASRADRPAFIDGPTGRTLTHGQVYGGARRVAASLVRSGWRKGDVLAICCPNLPEYPVAFHGAAMAGGAVTTANPLLTVDELVVQFRDSRARVLLTVPPLLEKMREVVARTGIERIYVLGEGEGATPFASLLAGDGEPPRPEVDPARDVVALPYSSGTTGTAKGVMITHANAIAALLQLEPFELYGAGDRLIAVLPFFHAYGMQVVMNDVLRKGATCVTMPRFDLEQYLALVQRYRITHLYVVPPIALALAKQPLVARFDLSSVTAIGCAAAPLDEATEEAVATRLGALVGQGYGMTEATVAISVSATKPEALRRGSVGRLVPNVVARIVDTATGAELGPGERGELLVRGPNVTRGYLNRPEESRHLIDEDGWLHTGDVAYVDGDGFFFIVDRVKELIKYKGYQVAPAQLEGVLATHPAVADAAVIGVPDEEAGEVPKAFVALKAPVSPEELLAFAAVRLAPYERIRELELVDAVPRSPSGKLLRRLIRDREREARARRWTPTFGEGRAGFAS